MLQSMMCCHAVSPYAMRVAVYGPALSQPEWSVGMGTLLPIVRLDNVLYNDAAFMQPYCVAKSGKIAPVAAFYSP